MKYFLLIVSFSFLIRIGFVDAATATESVAVPTCRVQKDIRKVTKMPNIPQPYNMRDWDEVIRDYYDFVLDPDIEGPGLPVFGFTPDKSMFCFKAYVGTSDVNVPVAGPGTRESTFDPDLGANTLGALLGATLAGNDMTAYSDRWTGGTSYRDYNFVEAAQKYYWSEQLGLFGPFDDKNTGDVGRNGKLKYFRILNLWPSMLFQLLPHFYPEAPNLKDQVTTDAGNWYRACTIMGNPEDPKFSYKGFDFEAMKPIAKGDPNYVRKRAGEPEKGNGAAFGWMMYVGWRLTGDTNYLTVAETALNWGLKEENIRDYGRHEVVHLPGPLAVARLNAELGYDFDLDAMFRLWFGDYKASGMIGNWEVVAGSSFEIDGVAYTCDGAQGWNGFDPVVPGNSKKNSYTNGFWGYATATLMGPSWLIPIARYAPDYARSIAKYALNTANTAALFQGYGLDWDHQDHKDWKDKYDPGHLLVYEGLTSAAWGHPGTGPYATGDRVSHGWTSRGKFPLTDYFKEKRAWFSKTGLTFALYQGNLVGFLGGIVHKTNIEGILQWDCLKTDYYHLPAYPTYLYYNPHKEVKNILIDVGADARDLYDAVAKKVIKTQVRGKISFELAADSAAVIVVIPSDQPLHNKNGKLMVGEIIVDF